MKYVGNITIFDDQGDTIFERNLTEDEIVEAILASVPGETEEQEEEEAERLPEKRATGRRCGNCGKQGHTKPTCPVYEGVSTGPVDDDDDEFRPCCGSSTRGRHKAKCSEAGKNLKYPNRVGANRRTIDNRQPFSEPTFNVVKTLLEEGSVDQVAGAKGLDIDEVRRCNLADGFEDYLAIA